MLSVNPDSLKLILLELNDHDLQNICSSNWVIRNICNDDTFWHYRVDKVFGVEISKYKPTNMDYFKQYKQLLCCRKFTDREIVITNRYDIILAKLKFIDDADISEFINHTQGIPIDIKAHKRTKKNDMLISLLRSASINKNETMRRWLMFKLPIL